MSISGLPNSFGAKLTYIRILDGNMDVDKYNIESDMVNLLSSSFSDKCEIKEFQQRADKLFKSLKRRSELENANCKTNSVLDISKNIENQLITNEESVKGLPKDFGTKIGFIRALDGDSENDRFNIESDMINLLAKSLGKKCKFEEFQKQAIDLYNALKNRAIAEASDAYNKAKAMGN